MFHVILVCDGCGRSGLRPATHQAVVLFEAAVAGWARFGVEHLCPDCQGQTVALASDASALMKVRIAD
jgi:hypothetical protein